MCGCPRRSVIGQAGHELHFIQDGYPLYNNINPHHSIFFRNNSLSLYLQLKQLSTTLFIALSPFFDI
jgi:hypothetical protein